jgi:iron(III) transport system permease protein
MAGGRSLAACLLLLLAWLVLLPAASVLATGADTVAIGRVLRGTTIIANTLLVGAGTTAIAVTLGATLALLLVRTDTPGRAVLEPLVILPLYVTPLLTAMAWSWLGSPRSGLLNLLALRTLGMRLIDMHGLAGVIVVASLAATPLPFLLIAAALRGMDPALEDAARLHGATPARTFARITLPLAAPAAFGAAILVFVQAMGLFSVPAILGSPGGVTVIGTEIYRLLNAYPPRLPQAAAWGLLLLAITALLVAAQHAILSRRSFVTMTGKTARAARVPLGRARWAAAALAWAYVVLAVVLPVGTLCWAALVNFVSVDAGLMQFGLQHVRYVLFTYPKTALATGNSLLLAALAAATVSALGFAVGWITVRRRGTLARGVEFLAAAPVAIPSIVLALGVLGTYAGAAWMPIYGTAWILLVAYVAHFLPFGARALAAAIRQVHPELEDAARVCGAGLFATLRRVVLPLARPSLVATATLVFVLATQEVGASILLYTSRSTVLSVAMFDLWEAGNVSALAALGVMQLLLTFAVLLALVGLRQRSVAA